MKHADRPRGMLVLRAQVVLAALLPLVISRLVVPGVWQWSVAIVLAVVLFAAFQLNDGRVWLLPINAVVSVLTGVPWWAALALAVLVAGYLVVDPIQSKAAEHPRTRWVIVAALFIVAAGIGTSAFLTDRASDATFITAQGEAADAWDAPLIDAPEFTGASADQLVTAGGADRPQPMAKLTFERPGSNDAPVTSSSLFIEPSVGEADLTRGPGHYPGTAKPGGNGNFAVAGHRTGWGEPFANLDELQPGDLVRVEDRKGRTFTYEVRESAIVDPDETWVLEEDPLGTGAPTITLTTCDPPGINTKRLIVWGTLIA